MGSQIFIFFIIQIATQIIITIIHPLVYVIAIIESWLTDLCFVIMILL